MFDCDIIDDTKKHMIRKGDIFFVLAILAAAFVSFLIIKLRSAEGSYAVLSYDGSVLADRILLEQPEEMYYLITYEEPGRPDSNNTDNSALKQNNTVNNNITVQKLSAAEWERAELPNCEYNVFVCADNEIRMLQSSCPDKICVHHSAISDIGENIICLPHKLVIEIKGGVENDLDGVAY